MSGITGVSSVLSPAFEAALEDQARKPAAKPRPTKAKATASVGVSVRKGPGTTSASVKVDNEGRITASVGQGVTIPIGDSKLRLGGKLTRKTDLHQLIDWLFRLFGRRTSQARTQAEP